MRGRNHSKQGLKDQQHNRRTELMLYNKEPPVIISQYEKDEQPNGKIGEEH